MRGIQANLLQVISDLAPGNWAAGMRATARSARRVRISWPARYAATARKIEDGYVLPIAVAAMAIVLARRGFTSWSGDALLFFLLLPVLVLLVSRKKVLDFGLRIGDWKKGALAAFVGIALSVLVVWVAASLAPGVRSYYGSKVMSPRLVLDVFLYMFAWEFLLRGFLLVALQRRLGFMRANLVQTFVFFLAHITKPALEFYSTAFTGVLFGYVSDKTRSIYSMVAIHTAIYLSVVQFT